MSGRKRRTVLVSLVLAQGRTVAVDQREDAEAADRLLRWAVDLAAWIDTTVATEREPEADAVLRRDHAPEASLVSDTVWNQASTTMSHLSQETAARIRREASGCARSGVLEVARQSIARHLSA